MPTESLLLPASVAYSFGQFCGSRCVVVFTFDIFEQLYFGCLRVRASEILSVDFLFIEIVLFLTTEAAEHTHTRARAHTGCYCSFLFRVLIFTAKSLHASEQRLLQAAKQRNAFYRWLQAFC